VGTAITATSGTQTDAGLVGGHRRTAGRALSRLPTYPAATGGNVEEILWIVDSLRRIDKHRGATPADWRKGIRAVVARPLSDQEAHELLPSGFATKKPFLRLTADPSKWPATQRPGRLRLRRMSPRSRHAARGCSFLGLEGLASSGLEAGGGACAPAVSRNPIP
jgi:hypothetical protein